MGRPWAYSAVRSGSVVDTIHGAFQNAGVKEFDLSVINERTIYLYDTLRHRREGAILPESFRLPLVVLKTSRVMPYHVAPSQADSCLSYASFFFFGTRFTSSKAHRCLTVNYRHTSQVIIGPRSITKCLSYTYGINRCVTIVTIRAFSIIGTTILLVIALY